MSGTLVAGGLSKIGRPDLAQIPVPEATSTHKPVPHHTIVEALVETLSFRHIGVVQEEYAVSPDGAKMFGVLDLETQMEGCRFSIGIRNSTTNPFVWDSRPACASSSAPIWHSAAISRRCLPSTPRASISLIR